MSLNPVLNLPANITVDRSGKFPLGRNNVYMCHGVIDGNMGTFVIKEWQDGRQGRSRHEVQVHTILSRSSLPVPKIHHFSSGTPAYVVLDYVPGTLLREILNDESYTVDAARDLLWEYGRTLATIHQMDMCTQQRVETHEQLFSLYAQEEMFSAIYAWLSAHAAQDPDLVFCHGDYTPMNVLFHEHVLTGVIDWENAGRGEREADIAKCLTANKRQMTEEEVSCVLAGYSSIAHYDKERLLYAQVENSFLGACILHKNGIPHYIKGIENANRLIAQC